MNNAPRSLAAVVGLALVSPALAQQAPNVLEQPKQMLTDPRATVPQSAPPPLQGPARLPAAVQGKPGIALLERHIARFIDRDSRGLPSSSKEGFLGDSCRSPPGQEIALGKHKDAFADFPPRTYLGDQNSGFCNPEGFGRIDYDNGDRYIGPVTPLVIWRNKIGVPRRVPVPNGLGLYTFANGDNMLVDLRFVTVDCGGAYVAYLALAGHLASFDATGRTALIERTWDVRYAHCQFGHYYERDLPTLAAWDQFGTLHLAEGVTVRGQVGTLRPQPGKLFTYTDRRRGLRVSGAIVGERGQERWDGPLAIRLERPLNDVEPGLYFADAGMFAGDASVAQPEVWLAAAQGLRPVEESRYAAAVLAMDKQAADVWRGEDLALQAEKDARIEQLVEQERVRREQEAAAPGFMDYFMAAANVAVDEMQRINAQRSAASGGGIGGGMGTPAPQAPMQTYTLRFSCGPYDDGKTIPIQYRTQACLNRKIEYAKAAACNDMARAQQIGLPVCE